MSNTSIPLTSLVKTAGCAAKLSPVLLHAALEALPAWQTNSQNPNLLVGLDTSDDACVYQINDTTVMIQTVDFFPPMVDDPYLFGQIAAANALSDVYAMGGNPVTALNLLCFPSCLDLSVLQEILSGGYDKVTEAGAVIAGGHTISDPTPKYGLSVTGLAHPQEIWTNAGALEGDVLVLTKPLGIGIMNTAGKAGLTSEQEKTQTHNIMSTLNKYAKEACHGLAVHSCTDVTGFGLMGHSYEMARASGCSLHIRTSGLLLIDGVMKYAEQGILPGGMYHNLEYLEGHYQIREELPQPLLDILFDPQTSGGLLLAMPDSDARIFLERTGESPIPARIIGEVSAFTEKDIHLYR